MSVLSRIKIINHAWRMNYYANGSYTRNGKSGDCIWILLSSSCTHTLYLFVTCGNLLASQRTNSKLIVVYVLCVNYAFHGFGQV